jgi:ribonuclease D
VRKGIALPKEQWPVYPRGERRERDPAVEDRMKVLKNLRSAVAERLVMDSGVLVNNSQLEGMARACPSNLQQLTELGILKNWQREVLGGEVVRALAQA